MSEVKIENIAERLQQLTGIEAKAVFVAMQQKVVLSPHGREQTAENIIVNNLIPARDAVGGHRLEMGFERIKYDDGVLKGEKIEGEARKDTAFKITRDQIVIGGSPEDMDRVLRAIETNPEVSATLKEGIEQELSGNKNRTRSAAEAAVGNLKGALHVADADHSAKTPSGLGSSGQIELS